MNNQLFDNTSVRISRGKVYVLEAPTKMTDTQSVQYTKPAHCIIHYRLFWRPRCILHFPSLSPTFLCACGGGLGFGSATDICLMLSQIIIINKIEIKHKVFSTSRKVRKYDTRSLYTLRIVFSVYGKT